jgi:hypothetical protein
MKRKIPFLTLFVLSTLVLLSFGRSQADAGVEIKPNENFSNLKVLPKDISEEDLKEVMRNFNSALGVKCGFCHAPGADGKMDFASDANGHKNEARKMMKMTQNINKKHFGIKNPAEFKVNCMTCHNGNAHPNEKAVPIPAPAPPSVPTN